MPVISREKLREWWLPGAAFLLTFAAYVATLPRTVSFEDSAEFVTAAATLGIPHASGYPLYVILAWPFAHLPFGTVPWRVALFSAVVAGLTAAFLTFFGRRLARRTVGHCTPMAELAILGAALLFAYSGLWWSQAIYAKVYVLHVLLSLALVYVVWRWLEEPERGRWTVIAGLVLALSWANHLFLTAAQLPLLVLAVVFGAGDWRRAVRGGLKVLAVSLIGLVPYVLLLVRVPTSPYVTIPPTDLPELFRYMLRMNYADMGSGGEHRMWLLTGLLGRWAAELGPLGVALYLGGTVAVWRAPQRQRFIGVLFAGALLTDVLLVFGRSLGWSPTAEYLSRVYGLQAITLGFLSSAVAVAWLIRRAAGRRHLELATVAGLLTLAAASCFGNYFTVAPFRDGFAERYARAIIADLPDRAVLVVAERGYTHDTFLFTFSYLQAVERLRTDVTVIQDSVERPLTRPALPDGYRQLSKEMRRKYLLRSVLADARWDGRPVFATFVPEVYDDGVPAADGLVYAVRCGKDCGWKRGNAVPPEPPADDVVFGQPALSEIVSHLLYAEAAAAVEAGDDRRAARLTAEAIAVDIEPMSLDYQSLVRYRFLVSGAARKSGER